MKLTELNNKWLELILIIKLENPYLKEVTD